MRSAVEAGPGGFVICRPVARRYRYGDTFGLRLMSDLHIGASNVDYKLIAAELEDARLMGDRILINGDVFDAILPKDHKRYTPGALHRRLQGRQDVLNAALEWGVELLGPYADLIDMVGVGNHDTAVEKWHAADVVRLLVDALQGKAKADHVIHYGGYTGFVDYRWRYGVDSGNSRRLVIYYHHGAGGASPVTKGMIDFHRKQWVRADIKHLGHKHNRFADHEQALECPIEGDEPGVVEVRNIMTGSYYRTYGGQSQASLREHGRRTNYAADAGLAPQGLGGARVEVTFTRSGKEIRVTQ